jgi:hypothetical protein
MRGKEIDEWQLEANSFNFGLLKGRKPDSGMKIPHWIVVVVVDHSRLAGKSHASKANQGFQHAPNVDPRPKETPTAYWEKCLSCHAGSFALPGG